MYEMKNIINFDDYLLWFETEILFGILMYILADTGRDCHVLEILFGIAYYRCYIFFYLHYTSFFKLNGSSSVQFFSPVNTIRFTSSAVNESRAFLLSFSYFFVVRPVTYDLA